MANTDPNKPSRLVAIYALLDRNLDTRYIGQSINPEKRFLVHRWEKKWVVNYEVIEWVSQDEWKEREIYWIWKYQSDGYHLTNRTIGGEGFVGLSAESLEKKRLGLRRSWERRDRTVKPETRAKLSKALKGRTVPVERRERISKGMKGLSPQWLTNRHLSPESIAKRTEKIKGQKRSVSCKRKQSESKLGERNPQFGKRPWNYGLKGFYPLNEESLRRRIASYKATVERRRAERQKKGQICFHF